MKKNSIYLFAVLLLLFTACSKDNRMASRMDGEWSITKADVYHWDSTANDFVFYQTYPNPGTVTLVDEGLNKKRDHYDLYTNPGTFSMNMGSLSGEYYWSVDVGPNNNIARIDFMVDDYPWYYYFSYSVEWDGRGKMIWTSFGNSNGGLDNGNNSKEIWVLEKQ